MNDTEFATPVEELRLRAMGSEGHLIVVGGPDGLAARAAERIEELESRWSRFRPDSEVCELTRRSGEWVDVSPDTVRLVERSIDAWYLTGASFDPTVLGAVVAAGYDRTMDEQRRMAPSSAVGATPARLPLVSLVGCTDIAIDGSRVRMPAGTGFDAGGIGKGLAADIVVEELMAAGAGGVCVNLGGDLRVEGVGPTGDSWTVAIEHPWQDRPIALVGLRSGAVATSTTLLRRWATSDGGAHHLIDPQTGMPSTTDVTLASVVCSEAWRAEVLAKAVLLRGMERAFDLLGPDVAEALAVGSDGVVRPTDGLRAFTGDTLAARVTVPVG